MVLVTKLKTCSYQANALPLNDILRVELVTNLFIVVQISLGAGEQVPVFLGITF